MINCTDLGDTDLDNHNGFHEQTNTKKADEHYKILVDFPHEWADLSS